MILMQQLLSRKLGDTIVTVYKQLFTHLFKDFRRREMFALLPNHCRYRYTYQKLSHNEGDISTRVLPLSVNFFLYINMGTAFQLLDFCSTLIIKIFKMAAELCNRVLKFYIYIYTKSNKTMSVYFVKNVSMG